MCTCETGAVPCLEGHDETVESGTPSTSCSAGLGARTGRLFLDAGGHRQLRDADCCPRRNHAKQQRNTSTTISGNVHSLFHFDAYGNADSNLDGDGSPPNANSRAAHCHARPAHSDASCASGRSAFGGRDLRGG